VTTEPIFTCKHCKKKFNNERIFMRHECTPMIRGREIQTPVGQSAYGLYKVWLEKQRRAAPSVETFLSSAYFTSFMKFSAWVRETGIPDPIKYVELMVGAKIAPALWRRNEAYQIYLEHFDKKTDPIVQATTTIETILTLAEQLECQPGEVFSKFQVGDILELIQQRRLSPWLLFCSMSFKQWYQGLHDADRSALMKHIGIDYWANRMESKPQAVKELREIAISIGI
jgi:hypothetical protein